jgi:serine/threonine protein kinase
LNGQYCVLRLLGRGGFGFVYQAQDTLLHDKVAMKELIPALVGDDAMLKWPSEGTSDASQEA